MRENFFVLKVFVAMFLMCLLGWEPAMSKEVWYKRDYYVGNYSGGDGTEKSPYLISSAQDLAHLSAAVYRQSYAGKYFKMTQDITLNDVEWTDDHIPVNDDKYLNMDYWQPIGFNNGSGIMSWYPDNYFEGIFDGNGYTIRGLLISTPDPEEYDSYRYTGLFGAIKNAIIRNLNFEKCYVDAYNWNNNEGGKCGILVGYMSNSQIINCHAKDCNVRAKLSCKGTWGLTSEPPSFGGLVGQGSGDGKSLASCSYDGYMHFYVSNNHFYAAGLMAQGSPTLSNCKVSGTMEITLMTPRNQKFVRFS